MKTIPANAFRFLLYAVLIAPLVLFGVYAFSERWFFPELFPTAWTTAPLSRLLAEPRTTGGMVASLEIAGAVSLLSLIVGFPAARALGLKLFAAGSWPGWPFSCPPWSHPWRWGWG